jgi:hypothetical protein
MPLNIAQGATSNLLNGPTGQKGQKMAKSEEKTVFFMRDGELVKQTSSSSPVDMIRNWRSKSDPRFGVDILKAGRQFFVSTRYYPQDHSECNLADCDRNCPFAEGAEADYQNLNVANSRNVAEQYFGDLQKLYE